MSPGIPKSPLFKKLLFIAVGIAFTILLILGVGILLRLGKTPLVPTESEAKLWLAPFEANKLSLQIEKEDLWKLKSLRDHALAKGVLISEKEDWIKAYITREKEAEKSEIPVKIPIQLRLKGDWTDHLEGKKWSFRIKTDPGYAWQGLTSFSVQAPPTRDYLMEWVFHQYLAKEGLLTTRYDFLQLEINGQPNGLYAIEEHFSSELLAFNQRPDGPVLKFSEDGLWNARLRDIENDYFGTYLLPLFEASDIATFDPGLVEESTSFRRNFLVAQNLFFKYKFGLESYENLFDNEQVAKRQAIFDIFRAYHGLFWHNLRFYYNPVLCLLEPICFDGYSGPEDEIREWPPFTGYATNGRLIDDKIVKITGTGFFKDEAFLKRYYFWLNYFSGNENMESFLAQIKPSLDYRETLLRQEYLLYNFNENFLKENILAVREGLGRVSSEKIVLETTQGGQYGITNQNPIAIEVFTADTLDGSWLLHAYEESKPPDQIWLNPGIVPYGWRVPGTKLSGVFSP